MPHPVTCGACNATFSIPDEVWDKRVHGQVATLKCRQCKAPIEVDGRVRRGSAVNITTSVAATPAVVHPTPQGAAAAPLSPPAAEPQKDNPAAELSKPLQPVQPEAKPAEAKTAEAKPPQAAAATTIGKVQVVPAQGGSGLGGFTVKQPAAVVAHPLTGGHQDAKQENLSQATGAPDISASGIANAKLDTETERELSWAPPSAAQLSNRKTPERSPTRPALPSNVSLKSAQESTPKPKPAGPQRTEAKSSPLASEPGGRQDPVDLWVVSFDTEDDRELSTSQLLDAIAKGTVTRDNIVWREGMTDWLPINRVPELTKSLKQEHTAQPQPAIKLGSIVASDDGDDETIIYRPGSRVATAVAKASPPTSATAQSSAKSTGAGVARAEPTAARLANAETKAEGASRGAPVERSPLAVARAAPSLTGSANRTVAGPGAIAISEVVQAPATATPVANAAAPIVKSGGGPPPLRRTQPSRPEEVPWTADRNAQTTDDVVTSVPTFVAPASAASPPPLPVAEKAVSPAVSPATKPAIFPPPVQSPQPASIVAGAAQFGLRATPSFAPRPSDIAALTKIRPKFPKWLPFAVLGGLVLLVAIMAALSWRKGADNPDSADRKTPGDNAALPLDNSPGRLGGSTTVAQTSPQDAPKSGDLSAGFANKFAQAAAKQRPSARFDKDVAEKALAAGFAKAAGCHNKGEPTGVASVTLSIAPSGQVLSVTVAPPFATSFTAECIRNALRESTIPPFQGSPGRLAHSITIH
jgi:hypothetical protein